jgi:hypothetical protein
LTATNVFLEQIQLPLSAPESGEIFASRDSCRDLLLAIQGRRNLFGRKLRNWRSGLASILTIAGLAGIAGAGAARGSALTGLASRTGFTGRAGIFIHRVILIVIGIRLAGG